jgi:OmpA-OmpF porin, OOP family
MKTIPFALSLVALAVLSLSGYAAADEINKEGYLTDTRNNVVRSGYDQCWRTGFWTPAMAIAECDADLVKKTAPEKTATKAAAPTPPTTPATPASGPDKPAFAPLTLQAHALFDFDKSTIRASGTKELDDQVVARMKAQPQVETILVSGHADRIGNTDYNQQLSQRRAAAVKAYLVGQGIAEQRIETASLGESQPVVSCDKVKGQASGKNRKLVECLQPNRRVVVEVKVQEPQRK